MIRIALPGGSKRKIRPGACVQDVAYGISPRLGERIVCATVDGTLRDVRHRLTRDCALEFHTAATPEGRVVLCHTTAHIAAQAVKRLFPDVALGAGPASRAGFYHDFEVKHTLTEDVLPAVEAQMAQIVEENLPIERRELSKGDARAQLIRRGEVLKLELLEEIGTPNVILYTHGDHVDLCRGPHVTSTGDVPRARLTGLTTATWRDDPHAEVLNRIFGTLAVPE